MNASLRRWLPRLLLAMPLAAAAPAHAAYSCNVVATSLGVIYARGGSNRIDATGTVTLTCTRDVAADANTLTYRIGVDYGDNWQNPNRRARRGASADYLRYSITRGATAGGAATCADTSNWEPPVLSPNVMNGTLNFGASATATVVWGYCMRVRGNQGNPTAGQYVDTLNVLAQYPATPFGAVAIGPFTYTIGARNQCVLNTYPSDMVFNYNSFQATPQVVSQVFRLACNNNLPWSVAIAPAGGTLLGLNYTLAHTPASGTGNGNAQAITITGTMPAGQQGTCGTAQCSASQTHTLTITY